MKIIFNTVAGCGKKQSDDRVLIGGKVFKETFQECELREGFVAVADGVGGNSGAAAAAAFVCEQCASLKHPTLEDFQKINALLVQQNEDKRATTFSGLFFQESGLSLFQVGNTRIYELLGGKYLKQLTHDDTVVQQLLDTHKLTEEESRSYTGRNEIIACFGGGSAKYLKLQMKNLPKTSGNGWLLTSDGIHEYVTIDEMEDILSQNHEDRGQAVRRITELALQNGSQDDCSIVLVIPDCKEE
ncbi:PP2C family protein-serine/threonine phosphatase [Acidaminococcus massiliensis]|uniref:PP2C family protein-serine/threonine phosphatase n=1 Tax=Acidaminococcus massiliensis TaxID=1852375 RepID=UPI00248E4D14|nr:protein phosphatase 2C domain-containing protein [Acidaminococcus massiliensis]